MKHTLTFTLLAAAVGLMAGAALGADELSIDEFTTTGTVAPVIWEPMITAFWVEPPHGASDTPVVPAGRGTAIPNALGESNQWQALKPLIRVHLRGDDPEPYGDQELIYSGWRRVVRDDGQTVFEVNGPFRVDKDKFVPLEEGAVVAPADMRLATIFSLAAQNRVMIKLDILMTAPSAEWKDEKVSKYFKVLDMSVTAHKVSRKPEEIRGPVMPDSALDSSEKQDPIIKFGDPKDERFGADFTNMASLEREWNNRQEGVFELRAKARVLGRFSAFEDPQIKTVEGAIRVSFMGRKMGIDRLNLENWTVRKPKKP